MGAGQPLAPLPLLAGPRSLSQAPKEELPSLDDVRTFCVETSSNVAVAQVAP
jgi:hypothetical protein